MTLTVRGAFSLARKALERVGMPPVQARHREWSVISSVDDLLPPQDDRLIEVLIKAASRARTLTLENVAERATTTLDRQLVDLWPGEHYRLLAALVEVRAARRVVEIGTFTGMGSLALLERLPPDGVVTTYDILPWNAFDDTLLRAEDFGPQLVQRLVDLSDPTVFASEVGTLCEADLIFVDGPKDGVFEKKFLDLLLPALGGSDCLLVFDDTRVLNMVDLWRKVPIPRLDATSFGHWSGTGLALPPSKSK